MQIQSGGLAMDHHPEGKTRPIEVKPQMSEERQCEFQASV